MLVADLVDTTHRAAVVCNGSSFLCKFNYDTLISSALAIVITMAFAFWVSRHVQTRRPGKLQMVLEFLFGYIKELVRDNVGAEAAEELMPVALPIAATIALYIAVANWLGAFPLFLPLQPANADFNQTIAMAVVVFLVVQWYTFKSHGFVGYFKRFYHLAGMMPWWMRYPVLPLWLFLSVLEDFIKPVTLSLRLFGNIFAGLVMVELLGALFYAGGASVPGGIIGAVTVVVMFIWKAFDSLFIGAIQAFIFMLLTIIYFGMAREGAGEEGHGGHSPEPATT